MLIPLRSNPIVLFGLLSLFLASSGLANDARYPLANLTGQRRSYSPPDLSSCALASSALRQVIAKRRARLNCPTCPGDRQRRGIGPKAGWPDPCCPSIIPSDEEAQHVVKALDRLLRAYCSGQRRRFFPLVDRHYELGVTELEQSFRRAHNLNKDIKVNYQIGNIRKNSAVIDVAIYWTMTYTIRKTNNPVQVGGTTNLALNRCDHFKMLGQKGTFLFGSF